MNLSHINMNMQAKRNRRYPELHVGDYEKYTKRRMIKGMFQNGHETCRVTSISRSNGVVFLQCNSERNGLLKAWIIEKYLIHNYNNVFVLSLVSKRRAFMAESAVVE